MNYIETAKDATGNPVNIYYTDYGSGKPIILIHGWPLSSAMWEYQMDELVNDGYRVIAYDRRGFGKSSQPWDGYNYDTLTDDLKALIDQLKLEDITLIGFSMGGGEVIRYFSRHGGKGVTRVILVSSIAPYMLQTVSNPEGVPAEIFDDMSFQMRQDRIGFLDDFGKSFFGETMLHKPLSSPLMDYFRMLCSLASPRATKECAKAFGTTDFRDEMKTVNVPTLIIHGGEDKTVPIEATSKLAAIAIPGSKLIIYEGSPHGLFYTEKHRLNDDILDFIESGPIGSRH